MADLILSKLVGTLQSTFAVARATFNAAGLTAARTFDLPDRSGSIPTTDSANLKISVGTSAPSSPEVGDLWVDTTPP